MQMQAIQQPPNHAALSAPQVRPPQKLAESTHSSIPSTSPAPDSCCMGALPHSPHSCGITFSHPHCPLPPLPSHQLPTTTCTFPRPPKKSSVAITTTTMADPAPSKVTSQRFFAIANPCSLQTARLPPPRPPIHSSPAFISSSTWHSALAMCLQSGRHHLSLPSSSIYIYGNADDTSNGHIAVGDPLSRLYTSILNHRIVQYTEEHHLCSPTQTGFRPHLSTTHQAFVLQHVIDKQLHSNQPVYQCFVDLRAAYDTVHCQWPLHLADPATSRCSWSHAVCCPMCVLQLFLSNDSEQLSWHCPLPINWTLSRLPTQCYFYLVCFLMVSMNIFKPQSRCRYLPITDMEYADDVFLLGSSPSELQDLINVTSKHCEALHMQITAPKTKFWS